MSVQTMRNRLHSAGLRARRPYFGVQLSQSQPAWTRQHRRWTNQQWAIVLFTDKSRFLLDMLDYGVPRGSKAPKRIDPYFKNTGPPVKKRTTRIFVGRLVNIRVHPYFYGFTRIIRVDPYFCVSTRIFTGRSVFYGSTRILNMGRPVNVWVDP